MGVDGSIYVVSAAGQIVRFASGTRDDVQFEEVDPKLSQPTNLWTSELSNRLYLLEPGQQRLLVFNKNSRNLQAQYVDAAFGQARSFTVSEQDQTVYLLTSDRLLKFSVT